MKAEKTPLRYIVQRIMRTILKSETGEKDLQPTFMTVAKGSSLIFCSRQKKGCNGERVIIAARRC